MKTELPIGLDPWVVSCMQYAQPAVVSVKGYYQSAASA